MQVVYRKRQSPLTYVLVLAVLVFIGVQAVLQGTSLTVVVVIGIAFVAFAVFAVLYSERRDGGRRIVEISMSDEAMEVTLGSLRGQELKVLIPRDEVVGWRVEGPTNRSRDILFDWRGDIYRFSTHQAQELNRDRFNQIVPGLAEIWSL